MQRLATAPARSNLAPPIVHEVLRSPGQSLDGATRRRLEPQFGHNFSRVRIHTDGNAAESARAVAAHAYTVGSDIVFASGRYEPGTERGDRLLSHELTHVLQQTSASSSRVSSDPIPIGSPDDAREREAGRIADHMSRRTGIGRSGTTDRAFAPAISTGERSILRRTLDVPESNSSLKVTKGPETELLIGNNLLKVPSAMMKTAKKIEFAGKIQAICSKGENASGYKAGIMQIETSEVNNARYKGATAAEGSIDVRRDSPTVRPVGPCADFYMKGQPFSQSVIPSCGNEVALDFRDWPSDDYPLSMPNSLTNKTNYLSELHVKLNFVTGLILQRPDSTLQCLNWGAWSLEWKYNFATQDGVTTVGPGSIMMQDVLTFEHRETPPPEMPANLAKANALPICNDLSVKSATNPAAAQAGASW